VCTSRPVSDGDPGIAPDLIPLRETLMAMTRPSGQHPGIARGRHSVSAVTMLGQPYLVLIEPGGA
jgi:hypothetical protein